MLGLLLKFIQGALKGAKREKLAEALTPEKVGEYAAQQVLAILGRNSNPEGVVGEIPVSDLKDLAEQAPSALGALFLALDGNERDAISDRKEILESYASTLNAVANTAKSLKSSLVLRGFIHRDDCISYWHLKKRDGDFTAFRLSGDNIYLDNGLELYLIKNAPDDEEIVRLNRIVRKDSERHLPKDMFDVYKDDRISQIKKIDEFSVNFERLDPKREEKKAAASKDPLLHLLRSLDSPIEWRTEIPDGAPALLSLFESMPLAMETFAQHRKKLAETLGEIGKIIAKG